MPKYTFEQFGSIEIEPNTIEINFETLVTYPGRNTFDVEIALVTENAKYIHYFKELPYIGVLTNNEVQDVVNQELTKFII